MCTLCHAQDWLLMSRSICTHIYAQGSTSPQSQGTHTHCTHTRIHSFGNAWIALSPQAAKNGWKCITTRWHSAQIPSVAVSSSFSSAAVYVCVYVCCCVAKCVKRWRVNLTEFPTQSSPTDKKYRETRLEPCSRPKLDTTVRVYLKSVRWAYLYLWLYYIGLFSLYVEIITQ